MSNTKDNTNANIRKVLTTISIIVAFILTGTYAFTNLSENNSTATGEAGCFKVNYSAQEINSEDLMSTTDYLEGAHTQITLSKDANCKIYTKASIYIHTNDTTTAPINDVQALKYKILSSGTEVANGVITNNNEDFLLATVPLTTTATTYDLYIWIDSDISLGDYDATIYSGYIYAESIQSSTISLASNYIIDKYNDGSTITTVNIGGDTSKPKVHLNATQGIMLDNNGEYRYYGADPNNYVSYNDELWRIISVGNVKSSETDTVGQTRVKIVKANILTDDNGLDEYSYDSSDSNVNSGNGVNDWSKADLMTELNTLYLNSTSGTCYTGSKNASSACDFTNTGLSEGARNLTADALYYLGNVSANYANDYYTTERGTTVYNCGTDDGACPRATTWTGRIGIIYPSDYAYATDLSICTISVTNYYQDTNCNNNDWLKNGYTQFTISPISYDASSVLVLKMGSGTAFPNANAASARNIVPVQYLKFEVEIVDGEGTSTNPYRLSLG